MTSSLLKRGRADSGPFAIRIPRFRYLFYHVYVACTLGANAVVLIPRSPLGEVGSNSVFAASWVVIHAITFFLLLVVGRQDGKSLLIAASIGAFVTVSALWSTAPAASLTYGGMLAGNILAAHLMATELSLHQILRVVARVILGLTVAGLLAYYIGYDQVYYFDDHDRSNILGSTPLRGFFPHKITAALYATLGAIAVQATATRRHARIASLLLFGWFVSLTSSATGLVLFVLALFVYLGTSMAVRGRWSATEFLLGAGSTTAVIGAAVAMNWSVILEGLGRDGTLTGRTLLWQLGLTAWSERPILGWGFDAYFNSEQSNAINSAFSSFRHYEIPHFHGAFIQTMVDLGIVGLAILLGILLFVLRRSYGRALESPAADGVAVFAMTSIMLTASLVMYIFLSYNHFATFLLFLLWFALRPTRASMIHPIRSQP